MSWEQRAAPVEPIAIVGMACRFPGAAGLESFWDLQRDGVDAITEVQGDRWDVSQFYDPYLSQPGTMNTRWGGFLPDLQMFDARFFGFSDSETSAMDPQHRLMLETAWHAIEDAAMHPDRVRESAAGVYVGISGSEFAHASNAANRGRHVSAYTAVGSAPSLAANQVSRLLGVTGPSLGIDTGCSSSLVAVHLACRSLQTGESDLALAGGVSVVLAPETAIALSQAWMMSAHGRCKSFDADADGYVRSEGCGLVVLKRLADAKRDGDPIRAIMLGTAVGHGGADYAGATGQASVARRALAAAAIDAERIGYIEAHGVGTPLADREELRSIADVYGRASGSICYVGSIKSNIGHLEAAAGIASLIRTVQVLEKGIIPAVLHLRTPNAAIDWTSRGISLPTAPVPWPKVGAERIAAVNSFGLGGTNAHAVVAEAPRFDIPVDATGERHVLVLSARTPEALRALAGRYADFIRCRPQTSLRDICFTAATGRAAFEHRISFDASTATGLVSALQKFCDQGQAVDAVGTAPAAGRRISLPLYPFERRHFDLPGKAKAMPATLRRLRSPALSADVFETDLDGDVASIAGHRVHGRPVASGPVLTGLMWSAIASLKNAFSLADIEFLDPLFFDRAASRTIQIIVDDHQSGARCRIFSRDPDDERWVLHAQASVVSPCCTAVAPETVATQLTAARDFYEQSAAVGLTLTPEVRVLRALRRDERESVGEVADGSSADPTLGGVPTICLQAAVELIAACTSVPQTAWVPVSVRGLRVLAVDRIHWGRARLEMASERELVGKAIFSTKEGKVAAEVEELRLRVAPREMIENMSKARTPASARIQDVKPEWSMAFHDATPEQRRVMLTALLREMVASHLQLPSVDALPANTGLFEAGLDSLALVEIRNRLQRALGQDREVPIAMLFNCPTPEALSDFIVREYFGGETDALVDPLIAEVQSLSEEGLDQSLREFTRSAEPGP